MTGYDKGSVRIQASVAETTTDAISDFMNEVRLLDNSAVFETILLAFPFFLTDFFDYLDLVDDVESTLIAQGYEGVYQVATFHPDYCFADAISSDVANYTNRSPFPMLHLLKEEQVDKAVSFYGDTDTIPEKNIICLRGLGLEKVKKILASCSI